MGYIPQSFIEELLARVDIVDVINARVPLRKTGHNYMACCPFHQEKTPSFSVVPDKQFYNCFGCGSAGSALKFVMMFDGLEFKDAIEKLAAEVGLEVPQDKNTSYQENGKYKTYYDILNKTADYFQANLKHNHYALAYVKHRGIDYDIANLFQLGFALEGWDNLIKYLSASYTSYSSDQVRQLLLAVGLWIAKEDGKDKYNGYDRFRNRLMFPIRDIKGRVIGFGGRVLDDSKPKYLNSPETSLYHKSSELYGLYEAIVQNNQNKTKINKFIVVEGYLDVIALFQHGINYAVAALGTATSYRHLAKLFKYSSEIIYCFDGDEAGKKAAYRALENSLGALYDGRVIKFLFLPAGHDPDTYIREFGKAKFEQQMEQALSLTDYLFQCKEQELGDNNLTTVEGRVSFIKLCRPLISKVPEGAYRTLLETELARKCQLDQSKIDKLIADDSQDHKYQASSAQVSYHKPPTQKLAGHQIMPSLWKRACLLLVHNPKIVEFIPQKLVDALAKIDAIRGAVLFYNIYLGLSGQDLRNTAVISAAEPRSSNIDPSSTQNALDRDENSMRVDIKKSLSIPEYIDKLGEPDNGGDNEQAMRLKSVLMQLLTTDPMVIGEAAEVEFKDLLTKIAHELEQQDMEHLKAKVTQSGMASLTADEKVRLQQLLIKE